MFYIVNEMLIPYASKKQINRALSFDIFAFDKTQDEASDEYQQQKTQEKIGKEINKLASRNARNLIWSA